MKLTYFFLTITQKKEKYLDVNLTQCIELYAESHDLNKSRDGQCPWIGRLSIAKMSVLSKLTYSFNQKSIKKNPSKIICRLRQDNPKIHMES